MSVYPLCKNAYYLPHKYTCYVYYLLWFLQLLLMCVNACNAYGYVLILLIMFVLFRVRLSKIWMCQQSVDCDVCMNLKNKQIKT